MNTTIYNSHLAKLILFSGYSTIMLFGFILTKRPWLSLDTETHEQIHQRQYVECMVLSLPVALPLCLFVSWWFILLILTAFYLLYVFEWIVRLFMNGNAYRNISFEREAYRNQDNPNYLNERKPFAWFWYYGTI